MLLMRFPFPLVIAGLIGPLHAFHSSELENTLEPDYGDRIWCHSAANSYSPPSEWFARRVFNREA